MSTDPGVPADIPPVYDGLYTARVRDLMTRPVLTIDAEATAEDAQRLMYQHGIHHLAVQSQGRFVGILSDRDLLRHLSHRLGTLAERPEDTVTLRQKVFRIATYRPITVTPETPVAAAAALLLDRGFSSLPVADSAGRIVGIVTTADLLRGMLSCALPDLPR